MAKKMPTVSFIKGEHEELWIGKKNILYGKEFFGSLSNYYATLINELDVEILVPLHKKAEYENHFYQHEEYLNMLKRYPKFKYRYKLLAKVKNMELIGFTASRYELKPKKK
jgi:hypothetical protein